MSYGCWLVGKLKLSSNCLLYTSDAADDLLCVDLGGRRIIKKKIDLKVAKNAFIVKIRVKNGSKWVKKADNLKGPIGFNFNWDICNLGLEMWCFQNTPCS